MTITDATFELTKCGAVENGFAVVEGKKVSVMRIWEYCECLCDYYVDTVIVNDMCEAPKAEEKEEKKEEKEDNDIYARHPKELIDLICNNAGVEPKSVLDMDCYLYDMTVLSLLPCHV